MNLRRWGWLLSTAIVFSAITACKNTPTSSLACESDADCTAPGTRCYTDRKYCGCITTEACEDGFFCNGAGVCQRQPGCTTSADCMASGTFCDVLSGKCLEGDAQTVGGSCGLASQCPYNSICSAGRCTSGCFTNGDCILGQICNEGQCVTGLCDGKEYCDYVERCEDGDCKTDRRGPFCRRCSQRSMANPEPCDEPRNFCLINNRELGGFTQFCGVDCSLGQDCPNGFGCNGVVILTQRTCFNTAECRCNPANLRFATATCTVAAPCSEADPANCLVEDAPTCNPGRTGGKADCVVPLGQRVGNCECNDSSDCADGATCTRGGPEDQSAFSMCCGSGTVRTDRECRGGEGTVSGFCSCATDDDCPRDSCDPSRGACAITGNPCTVGGNECGPIPCLDGGCLIGRNCAPSTGLSCTDVLGQ